MFNPDWIAPETVVTENLLPPLRERNYSILRSAQALGELQGKPGGSEQGQLEPRSIFSATPSCRRPGRRTSSARRNSCSPTATPSTCTTRSPCGKNISSSRSRMIGHECIRMEKPQQFAAVLLAESNGWPASKVKALWDGSAQHPGHARAQRSRCTSPISPRWSNDAGKLSIFADVYGLDNKMATALFGSCRGLPRAAA